MMFFLKFCKCHRFGIDFKLAGNSFGSFLGEVFALPQQLHAISLEVLE